jgi:hypothetical protein
MILLVSLLGARFIPKASAKSWFKQKLKHKSILFNASIEVKKPPRFCPTPSIQSTSSNHKYSPYVTVWGNGITGAGRRLSVEGVRVECACISGYDHIGSGVHTVIL